MSGAREKSCGAVIFREDGRVLLIKQRAGHISFPKGHVEAGENEYQTAIREVREETGIDIEIAPGFREVESFTLKNGTPKDVVYFLARPVGGTLCAQASEIAELGWFEPEEAAQRITYKGARQILRSAEEFRNKSRS